jgi:aldose sugar dehydrogenase
MQPLMTKSRCGRLMGILIVGMAAVGHAQQAPLGIPTPPLGPLSRGRNHGRPIVSFGRDYPGPRISEHPTREGFESPLLVWLPAIAVSGITVYTSDRFPAWKGNVLVGALRQGGIPGIGHLQRIVFNDRIEELRRESMLTELRQRIREVREGPDGFLYVLTEEDAALLRIEPGDRQQ